MSDDYYSEEMNQRREKFNNIINSIDMVLMNKIPEVDDSVWENWEGEAPFSEGEQCDIEELPKSVTDKKWKCLTHDKLTDNEYECEEHQDETDNEIFQWFAISQSDADYLKDHNQYITYSDMLDTFFLAITHFGTAWDYVDSMVDDILEDKE